MNPSVSMKRAPMFLLSCCIMLSVALIVPLQASWQGVAESPADLLAEAYDDEFPIADLESCPFADPAQPAIDQNAPGSDSRERYGHHAPGGVSFWLRNASNGSVTAVSRHDWGYHVQISGPAFDALCKIAAPELTVEKIVAVIPGISKMPSTAIAAIGAALAKMPLMYVDTGVAFEIYLTQPAGLEAQIQADFDEPAVMSVRAQRAPAIAGGAGF